MRNLKELAVVSILPKIPSYAFENKPNMETIRFHSSYSDSWYIYSRIGVIEDFAFANMGNVHTIDLSGNKIELIGKSAFANLSNLRYLDVSSNLLNYTQDDSFNFTTSSNIHLKLHLESNPFGMNGSDSFAV